MIQFTLTPELKSRLWGSLLMVLALWVVHRLLLLINHRVQTFQTHYRWRKNSLYIVVVIGGLGGGHLFEIGDRVQIGTHRRDVVDIRIFQFTLLEIGNWVDADQSTGRILHIPNSWIFKQALSNYHIEFAYPTHRLYTYDVTDIVYPNEGGYKPSEGGFR
jgi:hypothetical protein